MKQSLKDRGFLEELSLSARRAWIETISELEDDEPRLVALRKEGVD